MIASLLVGAWSLTAFALVGPSGADVGDLSSHMLDAYSEQNALDRVERDSRREARAGLLESDWEQRLSEEDWNKLDRARLRASGMWGTLFEQTMAAYGVLPVDQHGIIEFPKKVMQGGDFEGQEREWRVLFQRPPEGSITDENGKTLWGKEFADFLRSHRAATFPDGTTLIWDETLAEHPARLAILLSHEKSHFDLFAQRKWVKERGFFEREVRAYEVSQKFTRNLDMPEALRAREIAEQQGNIVQFSIAAQEEMHIREAGGLWGRISDGFRELIGRPRPTAPGYALASGITMRADVLARIRSEADRLRADLHAEREGRNDEVAAVVDRQPIEDPFVRKEREERAFELLQNLAAEACQSWSGASDDAFAVKWAQFVSDEFSNLPVPFGLVDFSQSQDQIPCGRYVENQILRRRLPRQGGTDGALGTEALWRLVEAGHNSERGGNRPVPARVAPAQPAPLPPLPRPQTPTVPSDGFGEVPDIGPGAPIAPPPSEPCFGGNACGPLKR